MTGKNLTTITIDQPFRQQQLVATPQIMPPGDIIHMTKNTIGGDEDQPG